MTTGAPPPKEGEKKATYAPTPINKPAAAPAKPAPKKDFSLNEVPTPILLVGVVFIAFIVQYVYGKVMHLQDLEKNWNPAPKNLKDNEVVILYCTSWQFEGAFRQVHKLINERADTDLIVRGGHYPVTPSKQFMSEMFQYLQLVLFFLVFATDAICEHFNVEVPELLKMLTVNKMGSFMFIWLFGNMVQSSFVNSQAFEIYHGNNQVWSSLEAKRMPNYNDIIDGFKRSGVEIMRSSVP